MDQLCGYIISFASWLKYFCRKAACRRICFYAYQFVGLCANRSKEAGIVPSHPYEELRVWHKIWRWFAHRDSYEIASRNIWVFCVWKRLTWDVEKDVHSVRPLLPFPDVIKHSLMLTLAWCISLWTIVFVGSIWTIDSAIATWWKWNAPVCVAGKFTGTTFCRINGIEK